MSYVEDLERGLDKMRAVFLEKVVSNKNDEDSLAILYFIDNLTKTKVPECYRALGYIEHPVATMEIWQEKVADGVVTEGYWTWVKECFATEAEDFEDMAVSARKLMSKKTL